MAHKYGGIEIPVPIQIRTAFPPVVAEGDILLGYLADYIKTVMLTYVGDKWDTFSPNKPIVKTISMGPPGTGFVESMLPGLFIYRPGRETRETIETFEQIADDYRFQKGRVVVEWILDPIAQEHVWRRESYFDAVRKAVDAALQIGRDPSWVVPGDTDEDAVDQDTGVALQGSALLTFAGAAVIELDHAGPGVYTHKGAAPMPPRNYDMLKMSINLEELLTRDLALTGEINAQLAATFLAPAQEDPELDEFVLGDAIYE